jgi:hypothetical protein
VKLDSLNQCRGLIDAVVAQEAERGNVLPADFPLQPGESRGTGWAETISNLGKGEHRPAALQFVCSCRCSVELERIGRVLCRSQKGSNMAIIKRGNVEGMVLPRFGGQVVKRPSAER